MPTGIVRNNRAMSQRERRPKLSVMPTEEDNVTERPGRETVREGPVQTPGVSGRLNTCPGLWPLGAASEATRCRGNRPECQSPTKSPS